MWSWWVVRTGRACLVALLCLSEALGACAGGDPAPVDGGGGDGTGAGDAPADAAGDAPADGPGREAPVDQPGREVLPDLASSPLPPEIAPPRRFLAGAVVLVGEGASACSHQLPASGNGDRWCGFKRAVEVDGGARTELWVINLGRVLAGEEVPCDGSSAHCLRLSEALWTYNPLGGPSQRQAHRFEGDTLFFHERGRSQGEDAFAGAISVWRPGWSAPRALTDDGNACYGHSRHPLAFCLERVARSGFVPVELDLRAGSVADPGGGPLPLVERVVFSRGDGEPALHATFTADGQQFVYSAPPAAGAPAAALRLVPVADIGRTPAMVVLPDVMDWDLAKDGQALYYVADYDDHKGTLTVVDFPSGANPRTVPYRVDGYVVLGGQTDRDRGLGVFAPAAGGGVEYRVLPDRNALDRFVKVFQFRQSLDAFAVSPDLRYTAYTKPENGERGFVARNDGSGECQLSPERARPPHYYGFLEGGGLVFWTEPAQADPDNHYDGWLARAADCGGRQRFADRLTFYLPLGDRAVLYSDELDHGASVLKYAALEAGGGWPATPLRIQAGVDFPVTLLGPDRRQLLFQVTRGPAAGHGLYLFTLP